ncbi:MAG: hypothetical protein JRF72_04575 [Deltaproteobacteria bacterium]|jgi:hypothetical protein|nr:hypothetical protein [Deltaproteobacteria bacterium]
MIATDVSSLHLLRQPSEKPGQDSTPVIEEEEAEEQEPEEEEYIRCRQCQQAITRPADRIAVDGSHQHTFANPHGIVFEIGCFKTVRGCGFAGELTDEFSWFAGYHWRVSYCSLCLTHLGWMFVSGGGDMFHGLILDRLIDPS